MVPNHIQAEDDLEQDESSCEFASPLCAAALETVQMRFSVHSNPVETLLT